MMRRLFPLLLMFAAGCAAQAPVPATSPAPPSAPTVTAPSTTSGGIITRAGSRAGRDSLPSQDALSVLSRIPEPLAAAEFVDPPASRQMPSPIAPPPSPAIPIDSAPRDGGPVLVPKAAYDTLRASTESESVPVPSSTRPLGVPVKPDSIPPPPPPSAPTAVAAPDTCWRIQVAAPVEREKAVDMQSAARSLLLVPMVIVRDAGRYKVRNEECLPRAGALALRDRALAAGFSGVFLVRELGPRR